MDKKVGKNYALAKSESNLKSLLEFIVKIKSIFFVFILLFGSLMYAEHLIAWKSLGETLLSLSVAITFCFTVFVLLKHAFVDDVKKVNTHH